MLHLTPGLTAYVLFLTFALGLCLGSFLNCMAWRLVHHESVWRGRSHCAACGHTLSALDLVPLLSYALLRGRCRYCGEKISPRYPAAELAFGLALLGLVWRYDLTVEAARLALFSCVLFVAALTDLESMEIPDRLHGAGMVLWLCFLPLSPDPRGALLSGLLGAFGVAGPLLLIVLLADRALGRESMGGGDLKLLFVTGLYLGWAGNLLALIFACILGLLFALAARAGGREFPFAPAVCAAAWLSMVAGEPLIRWYLSLF